MDRPERTVDDFLRTRLAGASAAPAPEIDRRSLLRVMGASLALAGLTGCTAEADETAMPYVVQPEGTVPGEPRWYATAVTLNGLAQPVLGKTFAGRPVKLEGNPGHPATGGATDLFMQASLLGLYDPGRSQTPRRRGRPASWNTVDGAVAAEARNIDRRQGDGFRLLTGAITSPTLARQIADLLARWPKARWHAFEPVDDGLRTEALARVFGRALEAHVDLDRADAVVSLDDDLLGPGPRQAVHARRWSARRSASQNRNGECRLFVAEPALSLTGARAEDRLIASLSRLGGLVQALAAMVGIEGVAAPDLPDRDRRWIARAAASLGRHSGRALVSVGVGHAVETQVLALLINERIGAFGTTLTFTEPVTIAPPDGARSLAALVEDMAGGRVGSLAVIGSNPAYAAPGDLDFRDAIRKVPFRLHAGLHYDETAALCHWHVPLAHDLESWSDARAEDGTASIIQPLIRPFYDVRPLHAVLGMLAGGGSDRDMVQETWRKAWDADFDARWREALLRGFVAGTAAPPVEPSVASRDVMPPPRAEARGLTVVFHPDPTIWDGRFSENAWLQETPKPFSKVTWGNVVAVSPQLAAERGLANGDEATLAVAGRSITGPVWIMPGQEARTVAVTLGYGRERTGRVGTGLGCNAFALRARDHPWWTDGATLTATGGRQAVATTQAHQAMDGFDFVRTVEAPDLDASRRETAAPPAPSFYPARQWGSPSWGMAIDLDLCIGCNACVAACVAENNIAVVGKELVAEGREMHWLRIDHYYEGDPAEPKSYFQPVPCMHCEQAPCEMGCPVNAAVHSSDGLNLQVYNRCIGTRTCSSFCPYKVRRFNWFDYTGNDPPQMKALRNPDVSIRERGVMEKCTYCVQRISEARIRAKKEGRAIRDGEVVTACQQACPTQAIVFGDVTDPDTAVSRKKAALRSYSLLEEANTRPRTTYLARIEAGASGEEKGPR
ncbi:MAG: 4Fe-4S dicluster domain-containing protein [Parvibaculaceae bacterium]